MSGTVTASIEEAWIRLPRARIHERSELGVATAARRGGNWAGTERRGSWSVELPGDSVAGCVVQSRTPSSK
eukprot:scaffold106642_cov32-Tisochrysis_lutea.AAC.2